MSNFATALGKSFNKDAIRIRSFELGGHTFRIKVPLTSDYDSMQARIKIIDEEKKERYYNRMYKTLMDSMIDNTDDIERKKIRNGKEQIKRDYKNILLILMDEVPNIVIPIS